MIPWNIPGTGTPDLGAAGRLAAPWLSAMGNPFGVSPLAGVPGAGSPPGPPTPITPPGVTPQVGPSGMPQGFSDLGGWAPPGGLTPQSPLQALLDPYGWVGSPYGRDAIDWQTIGGGGTPPGGQVSPPGEITPEPNAIWNQLATPSWGRPRTDTLMQALLGYR